MSSLTLPAPRVDFLDPRTGKVSREWVLFFQQSFERMGGSDAATISAISELIREILASIDAKEVEIAFSDVAAVSLVSSIEQANRNAENEATSSDAQIAELRKDIEDLRLLVANQMPSQTAELKKEIDELRQMVALQELDKSAELQKQIEDLRRSIEMLPDYGAAIAETRKTYASSTSKLSYFAATTSAELAGVISDETGSGKLVFATSPALTTPDIGAATGASLTTTGVLASTLSSSSGASVAIKLMDASGSYGIGLGNTSIEGFVNYSSGTANSTAFGHRWLVNGVERAKVDGSGLFTFAGSIKCIGGATFLTTSSALTNGAGASGGTLTNAPAAGNPTKWIGINDNGTTRYIPSW